MPSKIGFDPTHRRCIFPRFGKMVDDAMTQKGFTNVELAKRVGVDHTVIAGYRRGFSRPQVSANALILGRELGIKLDLNEPRPSARNAIEQQPDPADQELPPALIHLAAIALDYGYQASFTPISA